MLLAPLLSPDQIRKLHRSSLEILDRTGVDYHLPEAVELLRRAGASVEGGRRVRIPAELVEQALQSAPRSIEIFDREGAEAMRLEGRNSYFGTGPTIQFVRDLHTGERRPTDAPDIEKAALLCDGLPNLDFAMTMGMSGGVDPSSRGLDPKVTDRLDFAAMVAYTSKPLIFSCWTVAGLSDIHEMAAAIRGTADFLRERPFVIHFRQPVSPLVHDQEPLRALLFCAETGIPIVYASYALLGATAPATLAGALAQANAEFLSGLVVSQLHRPGAPVIYSAGAGPMDMRTGTTPYNAPEAYLGELVARELSAFYGLPNFSYGGLSDAKTLDQQAAAEAALSLFQAFVAGSNLIHDVGYMESGLGASWELMVLSDELIGFLRRLRQRLSVDEESLALELIERVGPGGNFLTEDHTLAHFREVWYPRLLDRDGHDGWAARGAPSLGEALNERARWILEHHRPKPLAPEAAEAIEAIVRRAARRGD
jgi:trimethylamine--corrinoid protein Co-methyltransferase